MALYDYNMTITIYFVQSTGEDVQFKGTYERRCQAVGIIFSYKRPTPLADLNSDIYTERIAKSCHFNPRTAKRECWEYVGIYGLLGQLAIFFTVAIRPHF